MVHQISTFWIGAPAGLAGESVRELQGNTLRAVILIFTVIFSGWLINIGLSIPELVIIALPVAFVLWGGAAISIFLIQHNFFVAQLIWQIAAWAVVLLFIDGFENPTHALYLIVLPFIGGVVGGWRILFFSEALVIFALYAGMGVVVIPDQIREGVLQASLISGLIGWVSARSLLTLGQWSFFNYQQASKNLREFQDQRIELMQVQEDLIQANKELARMSDRLRSLTQFAEDARRVKEEFVANVSHELRTPLNMIIGFSEVILKSPRTYATRLPETLLADIAAIQRNSQHLVGLVNDVLTLSQAESGRLVLSREWGSMREVVEEAIESVRYLFETKKLYLELDWPAEDIIVFSDRLRIREVMLNLLSNAGRFTENGGVRVRGWIEDGKVIIGVQDTGPGIAEKDRHRIFEPFQQLDASVMRKKEGSGLGLSISKRFVEMHDGKMWFESEVQRGTTFYFSLPLEPRVESEPESPGIRRWVNRYEMYQPRIRPYKAPAPNLTPRYLVLEEEDRLTSLMTKLWQKVEMVQVKCVEDLIAQISHTAVKGVFINTPDAHEIITQVQNRGGIPGDIPLFLCWVPGQTQAAQSLGVMEYLLKPVTQEKLNQTLRSLGEQVKTILVVDDNPEAVQLFSRMLAGSDPPYKVLRAMNGVRALEMMRERKPQAVILDLVMPEMDGFQVLSEKEKDESIRSIPVIIVSSMDPVGGAVISKMFSVSRTNGITTRELVDCFQAVSEILNLPSLTPGLKPVVNPTG